MTIWRPDFTNCAGPRYRVLADAIASAIESGKLARGEKLPAQRDLAFRLGVTVGTITRAYALAEQRGLVRGEVGRGTFVRGEMPGASVANPMIDGDGDPIKLTVNSQPDVTAHGLLAGSLTRLAGGRTAIGDLLAYTPRCGLDDHRAAAAAWASRTGFAAQADTTLITGGAHQAIVTALTGLVRPGDTVLTEALVYSGVNHVAARLGIGLKGLAMDEEGLLPDALDAAARETAARVLLVNPTIHNPTTSTMSEQRRRSIVGIAARHDLIIVEDDVYGQLPAERPPPIAAFAPERTVFITNASKIVAPGLRFGVLAAPDSLFDRLADAQNDLFLICPALLAALFTQWVQDGTADRLVLRQRVEAQARQAIAAEILAGVPYRNQPTSYHLWLLLPEPWRASGFVEAVRARGVMIDPAFLFTTDPAAEPRAVRISLSAASSRERLGRALTIIRSVLETGPVGRRDTI